MNGFLRLAVAGLALVLTSRLPASAEAVRGEDTMLTANAEGCGLIDAIKFRGKEIIKAKPSFVGASVVFAPAGKGGAESLFTNAAAATLTAKAQSVERNRNTIEISGVYTDGKTEIAFSRRIGLDAKGNTITVTEQADFSPLPAKYLVAKHLLELPLVVNEDPHLRMFAFGGRHRVEMFRMDMNDVSRRSINISDSRGYWPYWDIGGVLQLHDSYRVWKANHADTMAYPVEEGTGAPGWADYSELKWGVTVKVADSAASAPWAIEIDARKGVLTIAPHPASQPAVSGQAYGKRKFTFTLSLHEASWPTEYPCELDLKVYERLLKDLIPQNRSSFAYLLGTNNVQAIIHKERIQPSIALRALYRGDGYRMQRLLRRIGRNVPREQTLAKWEKDAKYFLNWVRTNGVPKQRRPRP